MVKFALLVKGVRKRVSCFWLAFKGLLNAKPLYFVFAIAFVMVLVASSLSYIFIFRKDASIRPASQSNGKSQGEVALDPECEDEAGAESSSGSTSGSTQPQDGKKSSGSSGSSQPKAAQPGSAAPAPAPAPVPAPETLTAHVAFYADSQSDTDAEDLSHQKVVNYIVNTSASTIFHAGDLLEDGTVDSLNRFNNVASAMCSGRTFYAAQGNNERNSSVFFDNFTFPGNEHWYSVNVGNLHMIVLDTYASSTAVGSEQYNWLVADLQSAASKSRATGVIFHYPVYGAGGDYKGLTGSFVPLFRTYGVDFVVSGHEHVYQKALVDGIYYFVASGQPSLGYMRAYVYSTNRVEMYVYNPSNNQIDAININPR